MSSANFLALLTPQPFLLYSFFAWPAGPEFAGRHTVYPKKYAHGFVVLCFVVVMQSFIMNSHEVFLHIHQGCFAGTGAIVCIFLGIYCISETTGQIFSTQSSMTWQPSCPGLQFKKAYELLYLRAFKFSPEDKMHVFQCMGKIFCVEFQISYACTERHDFHTVLKF